MNKWNCMDTKRRPILFRTLLGELHKLKETRGLSILIYMKYLVYLESEAILLLTKVKFRPGKRPWMRAASGLRVAGLWWRSLPAFWPLISYRWQGRKALFRCWQSMCTNSRLGNELNVKLLNVVLCGCIWNQDVNHFASAFHTHATEMDHDALSIRQKHRNQRLLEDSLVFVLHTHSLLSKFFLFI